MGLEVNIYPRVAVDFDDKVFSGTVNASASGTKLTDFASNKTNFVTRTGRRGRIVFISNAVSSGGDNFITFHVYVNGNPILVVPLNSFQQALAPTYDPRARTIVPIEVPQGALIEILADNSDTNSYSAFARIAIEYEDLN